MTTCRFSTATDCLGHGTLTIESCSSEHCAGPVDLSRDEKRGRSYPGRKTKPQPTKPAAPETREEAKTMPKGQSAPTGTCPACFAKDEKLKSGKLSADPICRRCYKKCANMAYKKDETGATKAHSAAKAKAPTPSKPEKPLAPTTPASAPAAAPVVVDYAHGRAVVLRFTCHEPQEVAALLIAARSMSCSVGLDG